MTRNTAITADVAIIGGGISGAAAAFFLSRAGLKPVIIERLPALANLTTSRSMEAMRAQFAEPENIAMMRESIAFYEQFNENVGLPDVHIGLHQQGYLFLTTNEAGATRMRERVAIQRAAGLDDVELLSGDEVRRRFPCAAAGEIVAGTFRQRDGWLAAHEAALGFARASGAPLLLRTTVTAVEVRSGQVVSLKTDQGHISASAVVIATGPYSQRVAALAGADLPLRILRRHRVTIGQHPLIPQDAPMIVDQDTGAHWRPEKPGAALAWAQASEPPGEPVDDVRTNPMFVHEVLEGVYRLCPFWLDVAETLKRDQVFLQAGQYTVTPDDKPIIGPHSQIKGLYFNTGFSGHGIMAAPGAARLLADLISGKSDDKTNPFSFRRLAELEHRGGEHQRLL